MFLSLLQQDLTIRFLEARTSRSSTVLFGFATTRVTDQHVTIVINQSLSEFVLRLFINILCVVGNNGLGNSGSNRVNLSRDTSTLHSDTNIEVGKFILSHNQYGFEYLQAQCLRFDVLNGLPIDFDETAALLGKGNCRSSLLPVKLMQQITRVSTRLSDIGRSLENCYRRTAHQDNKSFHRTNNNSEDRWPVSVSRQYIYSLSEDLN